MTNGHRIECVSFEIYEYRNKYAHLNKSKLLMQLELKIKYLQTLYAVELKKS